MIILYISGDLNTIINLQPALKFNGGGHINHSIFWQNLSPKGGGEPQGDLMQQIREDFSTFERMKSELVAATVAIQGSGWGWLGYNPVSGRLRIATCANQDPLQATAGNSEEGCGSENIYLDEVLYCSCVS